MFNTIMKSDDYALFEMSDKNRKVSKKQVEKIKDSIKSIGYINQAPILVDETLTIIDGQHRFQACKDLDLPIYYQILKGDTDKIMVNLNASQKNWGLPDYVNHYAKQGKEWFLYFLDFMEKYKLNFTSAFAITTDANTKSTLKGIKGGEGYEVYEHSALIAEMANRIDMYVDFAKNRYFLRALVRVYQRAGIRGLKKIEDNIMIVPRQFNSKDYCAVFENIINRRKRARNRVDLLGESYKAKRLLKK